MDIPLYQVDAFSAAPFSGNPAAVCLLDAWLDDTCLQAIATENNLSETAFLVPDGDGFELRWFTPVAEVALCGHATLASAFVLFACLAWPRETVSFHTRKSGTLRVTGNDDILEMDFPAIPTAPLPAPDGLVAALGAHPKEVFTAGEDILAVLDNERCVRDLRPDFAALAAIECRGTIVTARADDCDFVSRFFAPRVGVPEDPVTGSAHCALTPFWSQRLGKTDLYARQVSARGGELVCRDAGERVRIAGHAVLYLQGTITI
jgi:PhzF family phenazine biosynthesis protein